jgi:hypothetical protein
MDLTREIHEIKEGETIKEWVKVRLIGLFGKKWIIMHPLAKLSENVKV